MKIELNTEFVKRVFNILAEQNNECCISKENGELHFHTMSACGSVFYDASVPYTGEFLGVVYVDPRQVLTTIKHKEKVMTLEINEGELVFKAGKKTWLLPQLNGDFVKVKRRLLPTNIPADATLAVGKEFSEALKSASSYQDVKLSYENGVLTVLGNSGDGGSSFREEISVQGIGPASVSTFNTGFLLGVCDGVKHLAYKTDMPLVIAGDDFVAIVANIVRTY